MVMKRFLAILIIYFLSVTSLLSLSEERRVIGRSVEGRPIEMVSLGSGPEALLLVGGIHGGYEWNTVLLMQQFIEYYRDEPDRIPDGIRLHFVVNMNPDGLHRIIGDRELKGFDFSGVDTRAGRFNANLVDLNRNWDYEWEPTSYWGTTEVKAGSAPFSEPETRAVRDLVTELRPLGVLFFHSAADGLYHGGRRDGFEPSKRLAEAYAEGSGYRLPEADAKGLVTYRITGSASNYLYTRGIPAIVVELSTHHRTEFDRNRRGMRTLLDYLQG